MSRINIKSEVLDWALRRSSIDGKKLENRFPKIEEWRTGKTLPTMRQVEQLALATATPLGFFFLSTPPAIELPIPFFRSQDGKIHRGPSPELLDTIHLMKQRQDWIRDYYIELGNSPLPFVGSANSRQRSETCATALRTLLKLELGWASKQKTWTDAFSFLLKAAEEAGILVFANGIVGNNTHRPLSPSEFRGFVLVDDIAPLIFINAADSKAAQMFTMAHELAHVLLGESAAFDLRNLQPADDPVERACDQTAAEFLVPHEELSTLVETSVLDPNVFQKLARHFKVSTIVVARRCLDLRLIDREVFLDFYRGYIKREKSRKKSKGGDFYATQTLRVGKRFGDAVVRATNEGKMLYTEAYRLTGLRGKTFSRFANSRSEGSGSEDE